jgi:DNA-directed RNA polymerase alpha subunit
LVDLAFALQSDHLHIGRFERHGDFLLECKNFGVTSLTEVREKLTGLNLKLRGD